MSEPASSTVRGAFRGNLSPGVVTSPAQAAPAAQAPARPLAQPQQPQQAQAQAQDPVPTGIPDDLTLEHSRVAPGLYKPVPEIVIFEWEAPSRPFKKRNRQFFVTVMTIALLVSLILFFSRQFLPIAVVIAVLFLLYVLQAVPPHQVKHKISTFGITIEGTLYYWEELGRFWFEKKYDQLLLKIETIRFPGRITLVVPEEHRSVTAEILAEVLLEQKPELTSFEKAANWLQDRVPLE